MMTPIHKLNNRGAILITVYMVLFVLMTLSSSVALFNFSEIRDANRHRDMTKAFWLAEAGINLFIAAPDMLDSQASIVIEEEDGPIYLTKNDGNPRYRVVLSKAVVRGQERELQIRYPALSNIFESTISSNGNLIVEGKKSSLTINDKLRLGGSVQNTSAYPLVFFEDKEENLDESQVSIKYPDANNNGREDEFGDFVAFNRKLIARYPEDEVIYIQGNDTYTILPDDSLAGKKIIYIEGDRAGEGDAVIQMSSTLGKDENLTIITTGSVTHNLAGKADRSSQLNIIAWSDYHESSALPSSHNGMIFTHGKAYFDEMHESSVTNGALVANDGVIVKEVWSTKTFNYTDVRTQGKVPPGFEGLVGGGISGYADRPSDWREI